MKEINGDLFKQTWADVICITTNGFVKRNGEAVMGRGCAAQAKKRFPNIARELGKNINTVGNLPTQLLSTEDYSIFSYPVKAKNGLCEYNKSNVVQHMRHRFEPRTMVPGWALKATKHMIIKSAEEMMWHADNMNLNSIVIPRPGCGAGELNWEDIGPALHNALDDRFYSITF